MTPVVCRVKHDPDNKSYGDCLRACVASLLDLDAEAVPHFVDGGIDATAAFSRLRAFLAGYRLAPFVAGFDGSISLDELQANIDRNNPGMHYLLFCQTGGVDHVVVCRDGKKVHDPNWYPMPISGPPSDGSWIIMVLARL